MKGSSGVDSFLALTALPRLVVLSGSHEYDHDLAIRHARKLFRTMHGSEGESATFTAEAADLSTILAEYSSSGFFNDARQCIVRRFKSERKDDPARLGRWLEDAPEDTYILISAPDLRSNSVFLKTLPDGASHFAFPVPSRNEYRDRATEVIRSVGMDLDPVPKRMLIDAFTGDLGGLYNEVLKLRDWVGERRTVRTEDLEQVSAAHAAANKFHLVDHIAHGRRGESIGLLEKVLREGEQPEVLLATLITELRKLLAAAEMYRNGVSEEEVQTQIGRASCRERV